jgi:hypothetical protein
MINILRARARMREKRPSHPLHPTPYTVKSGEGLSSRIQPDVIANTAGRADRLTAVKRLLCLDNLQSTLCLIRRELTFSEKMMIVLRLQNYTFTFKDTNIHTKNTSTTTNY